MIITLLRIIARGLGMLFFVIGGLCGAAAGKMMVENHRGKDAQIGLLVGLGFWVLAALMARLSVLKKKKENFRGCRELDSQGSEASIPSDEPSIVSANNEMQSVSKEKAEDDMNKNEFYEKVAEEIDTDNLVRGVWVRAFAEADGDENRAKAIYIKLRVAKLMEERIDEEKQLAEQKRIDEEEQLAEQKRCEAILRIDEEERLAEQKWREEIQRIEEEDRVKKLSDPPKSKTGCGFWLLIAIVVVFGLMFFADYSENKNAQSKSISASTLEKTALNRIPQEGQEWTGDLGGGVVMEFVPIPAGSFLMGSNGRLDEQPVHRVTLSQPFWMAKTEVTQAQYEKMMGNNPSYFKGASYPVENVSWNDAMAFCRRLTERLPAGLECTLPTEAQWEYACRAGTTDDYVGNLDAVAWYRSNSGMKPHPVGTKQPNAWGVCDMHGNVAEWCLDDWHGSYDGAPPDGSRWGNGSGLSRVARDGCWALYASYCRSTSRDDLQFDYTSFGLGFRPIVQRK